MGDGLGRRAAGCGRIRAVELGRYPSAGEMGDQRVLREMGERAAPDVHESEMAANPVCKHVRSDDAVGGRVCAARVPCGRPCGGSRAVLFLFAVRLCRSGPTWGSFAGPSWKVDPCWSPSIVEVWAHVGIVRRSLSEGGRPCSFAVDSWKGGPAWGSFSVPSRNAESHVRSETRHCRTVRAKKFDLALTVFEHALRRACAARGKGPAGGRDCAPTAVLAGR